MKKLALILFFQIAYCTFLSAQVPDKMNYQAVIRNNDGDLITERTIDLKVSILNNTLDGEVLYTENHAKKTNAYGVVNIVIGSGNQESGIFSQINWGASDKYLSVKVDIGSGFVDLGTTQLLSVPYSFYSDASDSSRVAAMSYNSNTALFANEANVANALGSNAVYSPSSDTLFVVKDQQGNVVFAVFPDGAQVYVNEASKGKVGGFAVSGRSPSKADIEILRVTQDSTRVYVDTTIAKGKVGGFAVSGRSPSKSTWENYLEIYPDSARITFNKDAKGKVGGFAVSGRSPNKSSSNSLLNLFEDNYFIGHESGINTMGTNNLFLGYESGMLSEEGNNNVMIGSWAGYENNGNYNVFLGYQSGYSNIGGSDPRYSHYNTFVGYQSGKGNTVGWNNVYIGYKAGLSSGESTNNVFIGNESGILLSDGSNNVFVGPLAGWKSTSCSNNVFVGNAAGMNNTTGYNNLYLGEGAGSKNTDKEGNVFLGNKAGSYYDNGSYNVIIGNGAGYYANNKENVLIGSSAGTYADSGNVMIGYRAGAGQNVSNKLYIDNSSDATPLIYGDFTADEVTINGTLYANVSPLPSDINLKTDLVKITSGLKLLSGITAYYFKWNEYAKTQLGFKDNQQLGVVAQDVEEILPQLVFTNTKGYKAVDYVKFTPIMIEAIKEQQNQIEELKEENRTLKERLKKLEEIVLE